MAPDFPRCAAGLELVDEPGALFGAEIGLRRRILARIRQVLVAEAQRRGWFAIAISTAGIDDARCVLVAQHRKGVRGKLIAAGFRALERAIVGEDHLRVAAVAKRAVDLEARNGRKVVRLESQ